MTKANKDGWIRHRGGKCPVEAGVLVEVKTRDGKVYSETSDDVQWHHFKHYRDVMRYRIHKPAEHLSGFNPKEALESAENAGAIITVSMRDLHPGNPLIWRDRIHEIDRTIEALEEERVSLIQRLESEGLQLLQAKACCAVPVEDMSDWRNWKAGDLLECLTSEYEGVYEKGKVYEVKAVHSQYAQVLDDCAVGSCCSINDNHRTKFKFHSRPQS